MRLILPILIIWITFFLACKSGPSKEQDRNQKILADTTTSLLVQEWTKRIVQYPNDVDALVGRGKDLIDEKKYALAVQDFEQAAELDPSSEHYILWAESCMAAGQTKKAKEIYEKNVANFPRDEQALLELGKFNMFIQRYEDALKHLNAVVELNKSDVDARFLQGIIYKEMGDTSAALKKFDKVTLIDINNYDAWMQLGLLKSELRDASGLKDFDKAIFLEPDDAEPYYAKGFLYQRLNILDSAAMYYQRTIDRNVSHYFAYYNMGFLLFNQEKWNLAIQHFNTALKFAPDLAKAHFMLGLTNEAMGETEVAIAAYNTCLEKDPNFERAKVRLKILENR